MRKINKKGQVTLSQAPAAIQALIVIGIILAISALIMANMRDQATTQTVADPVFNVTNDSLGGFDTFGGFLGLIALVVSAAIILGLVRVFG